MRNAIGMLLLWATSAGGCGGADDPDDGGKDGGPDPGPCSQEAPWAGAPDLPIGPTQETASVALDGKVYVLGGFNGAFGVIATVQVFDTASCAWSMGPDLPMPAHHINAAVAGDTIYVVGSLLTSSFQATGATWSWAPARESGWSVLPSMPTGTERGASAAGTIDGKIYVAGGLRGNTSVNDVSAFDPVSKTWGPLLAPLPATRDHACNAAVGGKLYVIGGRNSALAATVYEYTPGGAWQSKAAMPTARGGVGCGVVKKDGVDTVIVVGGEGNGAVPSGVFPQVEVYTPSADSWRSAGEMKTPRHGMGVAGWNGKLYVPGGGVQQGFGASATVEVLTP